jgi:tetratricopeptide (TPR) repeat protein
MGSSYRWKKKSSPKIFYLLLIIFLGVAILPFAAMRVAVLVYLDRGNDLVAQKETEAAIEAYQRAIDLDPHFAQAHFNLARVLQQQGQYTEALAAYQKALLFEPNLQIEPNLAGDFNNLGRLLAEAEKLTEAIFAYQQAIKLDPDYADAYLNLGDAFLQQERLSEASTAYQQAIPLLLDKAEAYQKLGKVFSKQKQWGRARSAYQTALQFNPDNALVYQGLGEVLQAEGKLRSAIAAYNKALILAPKNGEIYKDLGKVLYQQKQFSQAIAAYRQSLLLAPDNADTYENLCYALHSQRRFDDAIAQCKKALDLDPSLVEVKFYLKEVGRWLTIYRNPQLLQLPETLPSNQSDPLATSKRSIVKVLVNSGDRHSAGTGWIFKREGSQAWIVTNRHVVTNDKQKRDAKAKIEVELYSEPPPGQVRKRLPAKIERVTNRTDFLDLAVLEVDNISEDIQALPLSSSDSVLLSAPIRVIGHPSTGDDWTISEGIVRSSDAENLILSVAIATGNSGSPVLDERNRVIGVIVKAGFSCDPEDLSDWRNFSVSLGCGVAFSSNLVKQQLERWQLN